MTTIPPSILQKLSADLLVAPRPKFKNDSHDLYRVYKKILKKINKIEEKCAAKFLLCKQLEKKFLDLYAKIKEKEEDIQQKDQKAKIRYRTERPFYYFEDPKCRYGKLFKRFR